MNIVTLDDAIDELIYREGIQAVSQISVEGFEQLEELLRAELGEDAKLLTALTISDIICDRVEERLADVFNDCLYRGYSDE